ncbi:MAG: hypothetical protein M3291_13645 [Actinomycetota bacterium]|nr:hypothetical protein [Actinomycetota bacterium]
MPADPRLDELSGLATDGQHWFAVGDSGSRLEVLVLDPQTCAVADVVTNGVDPYDVEDLALGADGALWLADTGDNYRIRRTVALHRLGTDGDVTTFRLVYPDGPHDAEALLLDSTGLPHLVTKDIIGASGVYRPAGPLAAPGPTPLQRVASLQLGPTDTPGGPLGLGSSLVTGAGVSPDGTVLALRTYTDAYLYGAPGGDVVAALRRPPIRIPLPHEPQGEAVALAADGTLLSGSEGGAPIRAVRRATALLGVLLPAPSAVTGPARDQTQVPTWQAVAVAASVLVGLVLLTRRRRRA